MMIILREVKQGIPSHLLVQLMVLHHLQLVQVMFHILLQGTNPTPLVPAAPVPDLLGDLIGLDNSAIVPVDQPVSPTSPPLPVLLPASTGQDLQISAQLTRQDGQIFYSILFENGSQVPLDGFMIQFNKNTFGLAAAGPLEVPPLQPGTSARTLLPMVIFQNMSQGPPSSLLQVAVKNNQQPVWYFSYKISLHVFFTEDGKMERGSFLEDTGTGHIRATVSM